MAIISDDIELPITNPIMKGVAVDWAEGKRDTPPPGDPNVNYMTIMGNDSPRTFATSIPNSQQMQDKGLRYSKDKIRWDLVPPDAMLEIARVYTRGAKKYAERNWEKGMDWSECVRALESHLVKWKMNESKDDEFPDLYNMAMVAWNAMALLAYELRNMPGDNRVKSLNVVPGSFVLSTTRQVY